jgi:hypothetical protein
MPSTAADCVEKNESSYNEVGAVFLKDKDGVEEDGIQYNRS